MGYFLQCFLNLNQKNTLSDALVGKSDYLLELAIKFNNFKGFSFNEHEQSDEKWFDDVAFISFFEKEVREEEFPKEMVEDLNEFFEILSRKNYLIV